MFVQKTFKNDLPTIYVVGTPIGNLEDLSIRAIDILKKVDIIYCEDTRNSFKLLSKYNITNKLVSLHKFNELSRVQELSDQLNSNKSIAIISDAGVPGISDPGLLAISEVCKNNLYKFNLTAINCGPAYIHAIVSSGFVSYENFFLGFLDKKENKQKAKLQKITEMIAEYNSPMIISFYESVHRISKTIKYLAESFDESTQIVIAREITKINEEFIRGNLEEVRLFFSHDENLVIKGEYCVILYVDKIKSSSIISKDIIEEVQKLVDFGMKPSSAIKIISEKMSIKKNDLYEVYLKK